MQKVFRAQHHTKIERGPDWMAASGTSATCPDCAALQEVGRLGGCSAHTSPCMGALRPFSRCKVTDMHACVSTIWFLCFPLSAVFVCSRSPFLPSLGHLNFLLLLLVFRFHLSVLCLPPLRSVGLCPGSTSFTMSALSFPQAPQVCTWPPAVGTLRSPQGPFALSLCRPCLMTSTCIGSPITQSYALCFQLINKF